MCLDNCHNIHSKLGSQLVRKNGHNAVYLMSVYFLTGTLGAGKTLAAVYRISETLNKGLKVATNLDLNLEHLLNEKSKTSYTRLPDQPTILDLESIGKGSDKVDEKTYGLLVLDELGTWLNSRNWNDKSRENSRFLILRSDFQTFYLSLYLLIEACGNRNVCKFFLHLFSPC